MELRVSEGSAAVTNEAGGAFGSSARRVSAAFTAGARANCGPEKSWERRGDATRPLGVRRVLGARSSGVAAEREARVVEMVCWRLGKWRVQGLMCWWRLGLRVYARGGSREEVLGDGGRAQHPCHTPVIGQ